LDENLEEVYDKEENDGQPKSFAKNQSAGQIKENDTESKSKSEACPSNKEENDADPSSLAKLCPNHKQIKNLRTREKYRERTKKK
jgi:hypothetical protein